MMEARFVPAGSVEIGDVIEHFSLAFKVINVRRPEPQRIALLCESASAGVVQLDRSIFAPIVLVEREGDA